jgi:short-subunit dehydrogenase
MAGLIAIPRLGAYTAAKFGVVGLSEVLRAEMQPHGIGVSVLCPGMVRTNLGSNNPVMTRGPNGPLRPQPGIDPSLVGVQVVDAIRTNELYVITHGEHGGAVAQRTDRLQRAFEAAPRRDDPELS